MTHDPKIRVGVDVGRVARLEIVVALLTTLGVAGCDTGPPRYALSGAVAYDGQPVDRGNIGFVPVESGSLNTAGAEIVDGRYEIPRHEGPLAGNYRVVIYAERPSGKKIPAEEGGPPIDELQQYIPPQYNAQSELTVEIDADREDLDFELEKPAGRTRGRR